VFIVEMAMMNPMIVTNWGMAMCQKRSRVVSECLYAHIRCWIPWEKVEETYCDQKYARIAVRIHGGAHSTNVIVLLKPIVATSVGK
jgi:hypothetical protein